MNLYSIGFYLTDSKDPAFLWIHHYTGLRCTEPVPAFFKKLP